MKGEVVLASDNRGKLAEFADALRAAGLRLRPQSDFNITPPPEDGATFEDNARVKAEHASRISKLPAIGDDSGLLVDALRGAPGLRSARFAGDDADDEANNRLLLEKLRDVEAARRGARYYCALVYADAERGRVVSAGGEWAGSILTQARGERGFGYDPLFQPEGRDGSVAEMSVEEKRRLSHRAQALRALIAQLK